MLSMRKLVLLLLIMLITGYKSFLLSQEDTFQWSIGEELTYKVKWAFVKLGTLKLQLKGTVNYNGIKLYHTRLFLDSNRLLFFVNMHNVYDTYIDEQFRPHIYKAIEVIDGVEYQTENRFNYSDSTMYQRMVNISDSGDVIEHRAKITEPLYDGISMTYFARKNIHRHDSVEVLSYFGEKQGNVLLNFRGKITDSENDLAKQFDQSYMIDGVIEMVGIAGVTGPYKGWFGGSIVRIPYKADMKVFIGSVVVELESISKLDPSEISDDTSEDIQ